MSARLEALFPGPRRTVFLRACLLDGDAAQAAWQEWVDATDDPIAAFADPRQACRRLAPLLVGVATGSGTGRLGAVVAASVVREELRWHALATAAAQALDALHAAGLDVVLTGGAAAAVTVYAQPWQRHCHDVDLVVGDARAQAVACLAGAGPWRDAGGFIAHASGTRVALHERPVRSRAHRVELDELLQRSAAARIESTDVIVAAPEHLLLRACESAFAHAGRGPLVWAADAATIARSLGADEWSGVVEAAAKGGMATPTAACLRFLRDRVGVPVPSESLATLEELAARAGPGAERACLALVPRVSPARRLARRVRRRLARSAAAGTA